MDPQRDEAKSPFKGREALFVSRAVYKTRSLSRHWHSIPEFGWSSYAHVVLFCAIEKNFEINVMSGNLDYKAATSIYDFEATSIKGDVVPLSTYKDHVCLIVNVASKCGLTATNYKELNELYDKYSESHGLRILAFPCNQFAGEEPGGSDDICSFATRQKVKFDLFEKIDVNGDNAHPLWKYLKKEQGGTFGDFIKWNFTKFIIDKNGKPVERHGPKTDPNTLAPHLEKYF